MRKLGPHSSFWRLALAPAVAAIWLVPWFVTQDGPAHVYNAEILASSVGGFDRTSPWHDVYTVRWQPIPNWAGPVTLAALVAWLPAWVADRIMTSVTLVGFALAILWLRWRVAGGRDLSIAAILASILSMNMAWLFGFTSFMLGACLFPITLGVWWPGRDRLSAASSGGARCASDARLLLSPREPWADRRRAYWCSRWRLRRCRMGRVRLRQRLTRLALTCLTFLPVIILGICYMRIATGRRTNRPAVGEPARTLVAAGLGGDGSSGLIRCHWRSATGCRSRTAIGPAVMSLSRQ